MTSRGLVIEADLQQRLARVAIRLSAQVRDLRPMPGSASLTYAATLWSADFESPIVIKIAPPGVAPVGHRDVLRQARLLRTIRDEFPEAPQVIFEDAGDPPDVPPLYAMEMVGGDTVEPILDEHKTLPSLPEMGGRMCSAARTLARMHAIRLTETELRNEPVVDLVAEVDRWARALGTAPDDLRHGWAEAASRLIQSLPTSYAAVVAHGDYRLGNLVCSDGEVRAVIDWEIWTLGDPRLDLAWLLMYNDADKLPIATRHVANLPTDEVLVAAYEEAHGSRIEDLAWFSALSYFKAGSHLALAVKHNRRRSKPDPRLAAWDPWGPAQLIARSLDLLSA